MFPVLLETFGEMPRFRDLLELTAGAYVGDGVLGSAVASRRVLLQDFAAENTAILARMRFMALRTETATHDARSRVTQPIERLRERTTQAFTFAPPWYPLRF